MCLLWPAGVVCQYSMGRGRGCAPPYSMRWLCRQRGRQRPSLRCSSPWGSSDPLATRGRMSGSNGRASSRAPCDDDSSHDQPPFSRRHNNAVSACCSTLSLSVSVFSVYGGRVCERTRCVGASCWPLVHRCSPSSRLVLHAERGWFMHLPLLLLHLLALSKAPSPPWTWTRTHLGTQSALHSAPCPFGQDRKPTAQRIHIKTVTQLPPDPVQSPPLLITNPISRPHRSGLP